MGPREKQFIWKDLAWTEKSLLKVARSIYDMQICVIPSDTGRWNS